MNVGAQLTVFFLFNSLSQPMGWFHQSNLIYKVPHRYCLKIWYGYSRFCQVDNQYEPSQWHRQINVDIINNTKENQKVYNMNNSRT